MRIGISFPVGLGLPRLFIDPEIEIPDPPPRPAPEEPEMSLDPKYPRPQPLNGAALKVARFWGLIAAALGMASTYGLITMAQEKALLDLGDQIAPTVTLFSMIFGGLLPLVSNVIGAFRTAKKAEPDVTPVADPAYWDADDERLVRMVPLRFSGRAGRHAREDTL